MCKLTLKLRRRAFAVPLGSRSRSPGRGRGIRRRPVAVRRFQSCRSTSGGRPASPPPRAWSDFRNLEKTSRLLQGAAPGHRCRLGGRGATRAFADGEAAVPPISVISNVVSILHSVADCGAGWGAAVQPSSATSARHARQAVRMASKCNLEKTLQITSRRRGGRGGGKREQVFKIKSADVSLRDLRATARFLVKPSSM